MYLVCVCITLPIEYLSMTKKYGQYVWQVYFSVTDGISTFEVKSMIIGVNSLRLF